MMNKAAGSGYREAQLNCPNCKALLEVREILGSPVDCCRDCGALWVDWFDGDLPGIVRETREAAENGSDRKPPSGRASLKNALPCCPRCSRPLSEEQFQRIGPSIFRCGECLGAFVPAERVAELARFEPANEDAAQEGESGFWRGLIERIRLALSGP